MSNQDVLNEKRIASMWSQVDLESGQTPLFATLRKKDQVRQEKNVKLARRLFKDIEGFEFDEQKITGRIVGGQLDGNYEDLAKQLSAMAKSDGKNTVQYANRLRNIADARNKTWAQQFLGSGIGTEQLSASQPVRGGGISNYYGFTSMEHFARSGMTDHLGRLSKFAVGYGLGEAMMNSVGLATSHQKAIMRSANVGLIDRASAAAPVLFGGIYSMSEALPYLSGDKNSTLTDNAATAVLGTALSTSALVYGFRVGKEATHVATSPLKAIPWLADKQGQSLTALGRTRGLGKWLSGFGVGALTGVAAMQAVDFGVEQFKTAANRDNSIQKVKRMLYTGDTSADASVKTNQLLTARQRTVSKLNKSALNDRGYIMGNEAMILKGIL